jgi:SAM-dependent methyltransferase
MPRDCEFASRRTSATTRATPSANWTTEWMLWRCRPVCGCWTWLRRWWMACADRGYRCSPRWCGPDGRHVVGGTRDCRNINTAASICSGGRPSTPFGAGSVDRILCTGVLYHVPDCERALREMRRVLRDGGRAVISTSGAYATRRIYELHADAARELGYDPLPITPGHFRCFRLRSGTSWMELWCSTPPSRQRGIGRHKQTRAARRLSPP